MRYGRRIVAAWAAAIAMCLVPLTAQAQPEFYGDIRGGLAQTQIMRFAQPNTANLSIDPHTAWVLSGTLGVHVAGPFRVEGIVSYQRGGIGGAFNENILPIVACGMFAGQPCLDRDIRGKLKVPSLFTMGHYDMRLAPSLGLSLGGGVGAVRMDLDARTTARFNSGVRSSFTLIDDTDTVLAGRVEVNLIYGSGPLRFLLGYSYTRTSRMSLRGQGVYTAFNFNPRLDSHQLMAGLRFRF